MLPAALVTIVLIELAYCLTFAYLAMGSGMMQQLDGIAICILAYLISVRVLLVLVTFLVAHLLNPAQPAMRFFKRLGMMARESVMTLLAFSFLIPLSFFFAPRLRRAVPPTVVLMVHGFMSNSGIWWWLARQLRANGGAGVDSLNLAPIFGDIECYLPQLNQRIAQLRARGATRIVLVGHSMGGLVCRAWLHDHVKEGLTADGLRCSLVTLCTPWHGTRIARIARFFPGRNLAQMTHQSAWGKSRLRTPDLSAMSMYSAHDNVVIPYTSGIDAHIDSTELHGLGHLSVLFDRAVATAIVERCRPTQP
jgi:triacylglycerol lipase